MPAPFISWAPNANYATGTGFAWQGAPTKVTPAYVEFQPSPTFAPSAQELNELFAARDAYMNALAEEASPPTFMPEYILNTLAGAVTASVCAWDPVTLKWLIGGVDTGPHVSIVSGRGGLFQWVFQGGGASAFSGTLQSVCRGIEPSVSNKYLYGGNLTSGGNAVVVQADTSANTFTGFSFPAGSISDATAIQVISISGVVVAAIGSTNPAHTGLFHSTDHGATWTSTSLGGVTVQQWLLVQSIPGAGTIMLFGQFAGVLGYLTSTDGITWTAQSAPTLTGTETPTTLCYGVDGSGVACWILSTADSSSLATKIYRSYDGASWTTVTNSLPASTPLLRMACAEQQLVAVVEDVTGAGLDRVIYSVDGGSTWLTTNLEILVGTAAHCSIASSGNQFLIATDAVVCASTCVGPAAGLGAK